MTLLNEVMNRPLDAGYAEAAARRAAGERPSRPLTVAVAALAAAVLGLGAGTAVAALRAPAPEKARARASLEEKVAARGQTVADLAAVGRALTMEVAAAEAQALDSTDPAIARLSAGLAVTSGAVALRGPGLVIELIEDSAAVSRGVVEAQITSSDLQCVVNGLWEAGAEAISVNGIRLTATSPISSGGGALLVDLVPVGSPLTVTALGDGQVMEIRFARTSGAARLQLLRSDFGAKVSIGPSSDLRVPAAARAPALYHAQPVAQPVSRPAPPSTFPPTPPEGTAP
ncbi:MAG: DUF881 domain-containing protein [Micrococcales bacterium]|nr:DUF881 domain-containing protein [Micrococcales bacterium]